MAELNEDGLRKSTLASYIKKAKKSKKNRQKGIDRAEDRLNPNQRFYVHSKEKLKEEAMNPITEAIKAIREGNLDEMRNQFNKALAQKAVEKLEEKKLEIASTYFGQE